MKLAVLSWAMKVLLLIARIWRRKGVLSNCLERTDLFEARELPIVVIGGAGRGPSFKCHSGQMQARQDQFRSWSLRPISSSSIRSDSESA